MAALKKQGSEQNGLCQWTEKERKANNPNAFLLEKIRSSQVYCLGN